MPELLISQSISHLIIIIIFALFINKARAELLEKDMATHSCVLAWRIPGMAGPGRLPSMGSHKVEHD